VVGALIVAPAVAALVAVVTIIASVAGLEYGRTLRQAERSNACSQCGRQLGDGAVDTATAAYKAEVANLRRKCPNAPYFARPVRAVCVRCSARYAFRGSDGFVLYPGRYGKRA
jgi:hypothetical protein